jgi:hypothetical protein
MEVLILCNMCRNTELQCIGAKKEEFRITVYRCEEGGVQNYSVQVTRRRRAELQCTRCEEGHIYDELSGTYTRKKVHTI